MNTLSSNAATNIEPVVSSPSSKPEETKPLVSLGRDDNRKAGKPDVISSAKMDTIVESLNDYMDMLQTTLGFSVDKRAEQIVVTVKNRESGEIIRQIPSEELLAIQEKMEELTGLILNKRA
ncbi:MAG: flagellar protein FlaG [Proteobacteria bacterium]|nr:flagellar protein FlaG [Pseudomonadota bacterium]